MLIEVSNILHGVLEFRNSVVPIVELFPRNLVRWSKISGYFFNLSEKRTVLAIIEAKKFTLYANHIEETHSSFLYVTSFYLKMETKVC